LKYKYLCVISPKTNKQTNKTKFLFAEKFQIEASGINNFQKIKKYPSDFSNNSNKCPPTISTLITQAAGHLWSTIKTKSIS